MSFSENFVRMTPCHSVPDCDILVYSHFLSGLQCYHNDLLSDLLVLVRTCSAVLCIKYNINDTGSVLELFICVDLNVAK